MYQNYSNHTIYKPTTTTSDYGEKIKTFAQSGTIFMSIQIETHSEYTSNQYTLMDVTHIGIASSHINTVAVGDRLDNIYEVKFIQPTKKYKVYYLEEVIA